MNRDDSEPPDSREGASGPDSGRDPVETLLRLLVAGAARGSDALLSGRPDATAVRARHALVGLLFEAYDLGQKSVSEVSRVTGSAARLGRSVLGPLVGSPVVERARRPFDFLVERGAEELDRLARSGRVEEDRSLDVLRRMAALPVDEILEQLKNDPATERLVRRQAEALLAGMAEDPQLGEVVRRQGDRYVDHLHEHPESVQDLVRGQSLSLAEEVANAVRERTTAFDALLERVVRAVLLRRPREALPQPPAAVQALADPSAGPVPAGAGLAAPRGQYAGFASRLLAFAVDAAVIALVTTGAAWAGASLLLYLQVDVRACPELTARFDVGAWSCHLARWLGLALGSVFPSLYTLFFWTTTGQTPGKAVMGVRVVRLDGRPMNLLTAVLRLAGYAAALLTFGLGFLMMLADGRRQGLADKLARTCVVYSWSRR
jgi:uncharacterized RDD family membrane protein YckC